ncbi:MAG: NAAT family transporter [Chlamydiae bacterium]|nr:NAAT family transporter [Chlamydiota bacterium]
MDFGDFIKFYISLLVVCNPFSAIPAVIGFTKNRSHEEKNRTSLVTSISVAVIFLVSIWMGKPLLDFFDIRISAFQLAGGFVLLLLSLSLLNAEESPIQKDSEDSKEGKKRSSFAVVPLAIPIIAGPGAISTAIVFNASYVGVFNKMIMSVSGLLVAVSIYLCLHFSTKLERLLGSNGINIMGRIGGLILAAIAVETMSKGAIALFPGLAG